MDKFIVSARKYRPATFESVVGQRHITSTLINAIGRNQLAHAYLFCGPRGVGKTTCARIFAKAINCLSSMGGEACGQCESCQAFDQGRSFNIHELDAASNNSVDDIRSLTDQVRIPPQIGRYSVYIIDEVHMLSAQAFNAFLKTLEEPPAHAIFILATTEKHKIIPTILSRCQIFDFNRIRVEDGVGYLKLIASKEEVVYDDESLHLIALKADGSMRDALSMFDKAISFCGAELNFKEVAQTLNVLDYDTYFNVTELILSGDYPAVLSLFDEVLRKGFSGQIFIGGLNAHFRDMLMCKSPQTMALLEVTGALLQRYSKQAVECDVGFLFDSIALLTALDGTLRTATNQRLNVELGLMKLCGLGQKKKELTPSSAELPPLRRAQEQSKAELKPEPASEPAPEPTPKPAPKPAPEPASEPASEPTPRETAEPKVVEDVQPSASEPTAGVSAASAGEQQPPKSPPTNGNRNGNRNGSSIVSGTSITDLLGSPKKRYEVAQEKTDGDTPAVGENRSDLVIDPDSEAKMNGVKDKFIVSLSKSRPRIAMAFHNMNIDAHQISITVASEPLREEIMRNRTEILMSLIEMAELNGVVELNVIVDEDTSDIRPIKFEDKLQYLTEQNQTLTLLRQALDLIE